MDGRTDGRRDQKTKRQRRDRDREERETNREREREKREGERQTEREKNIKKHSRQVSSLFLRRLVSIPSLSVTVESSDSQVSTRTVLSIYFVNIG